MTREPFGQLHFVATTVLADESFPKHADLHNQALKYLLSAQQTGVLEQGASGPVGQLCGGAQKTTSTISSAQKVCEGFWEQEFNASRSGSGVEVTGSGYIPAT